MCVMNNIAERGVALIEEYNKLLTNDEEQKKFLLLAVTEYRRRYPDRNKETLMQRCTATTTADCTNVFSFICCVFNCLSNKRMLQCGTIEIVLKVACK